MKIFQNNQSDRLQLPGKYGEFDLLEDEEQESGNRFTSGVYATDVYQSQSDLYNETREVLGKRFFHTLKIVLPVTDYLVLK
jgi:hypothetical protein